jgi:hypothetical protein
MVNAFYRYGKNESCEFTYLEGLQVDNGKDI